MNEPDVIEPKPAAGPDRAPPPLGEMMQLRPPNRRERREAAAKRPYTDGGTVPFGPADFLAQKLGRVLGDHPATDLEKLAALIALLNHAARQIVTVDQRPMMASQVCRQIYDGITDLDLPRQPPPSAAAPA